MKTYRYYRYTICLGGLDTDLNQWTVINTIQINSSTEVPIPSVVYEFNKTFDFFQ